MASRRRGQGAWDERASSQMGSVRAGPRGLLLSRGEAFARVTGGRLSRRPCSTITVKKATSTTSGLRRMRRWGGWATIPCSFSTGPTAPCGQVTRGWGADRVSCSPPPSQNAALLCVTKFDLRVTAQKASNVTVSECFPCVPEFHDLLLLPAPPHPSLNETDLDHVVLQ